MRNSAGEAGTTTAPCCLAAGRCSTRTSTRGTSRASRAFEGSRARRAASAIRKRSSVRWRSRPGIRYRDQEPIPGFHPVGGDALQAWDEAPGALPDIRFVEGWLEVPSALDALEGAPRAAGGRDRHRERRRRPQGVAARPGTVRVLVRSAERLALEVEAPDGGWLFVLRAFWPYRTILLDGRPVEASPAQLAFCAVPVPPGRHRVWSGRRSPGFRSRVGYGPALSRDPASSSRLSQEGGGDDETTVPRAALDLDSAGAAACRKESYARPKDRTSCVRSRSGFGRSRSASCATTSASTPPTERATRRRARHFSRSSSTAPASRTRWCARRPAAAMCSRVCPASAATGRSCC